MDPVPSGGVGLSYPDSVDSSPSSCGGESWDEPFPSSASASASASAVTSSKLRLMCSYGGRIVPRPTDKSLCYLGGETRIVVVERHSSLSHLSSKLFRSLLQSPHHSFTLKYQLPNEDLDSLISVTTDEDLDNMIEEYDRIAAASSHSGSKQSSRIRLFLFSTKLESAPSSIGSLLDDSKSETWFVDVLNGAMGSGMGSTDSASVNCLLGLEEDSNSVHSQVGGAAKADPGQVALQRPDSSGKLGRDVNSVPDSLMLETSSSFGSTSSAPSLSNLPPIRVRPDDRPPDQRYANLDDHFQQMNLWSAVAPPPPTTTTTTTMMQLPTAAANPSISPTEYPNRVFESDNEKPDTRILQQATNQQNPPPMEAPISDSRPVVYYHEKVPVPTPFPPVMPISDPKGEFPIMDVATAYRMQQRVPLSESGYVVPTISAPEQLHPIQHTQQHSQQQQFVAENPHLVQLPPYYQLPSHPIQQSQQFNPSIPMYYVPSWQNPQPQAPKSDLQKSNHQIASPLAPSMMQHIPNPGSIGVVYHHPSQMGANNFEYATNADTMYPQVYYTTGADTMHPQLYFAQAPSSMQGQFQTVISDGQQAAEVKQNRAS